jgi:hypothetical protein
MAAAARVGRISSGQHNAEVYAFTRNGAMGTGASNGGVNVQDIDEDALYMNGEVIYIADELVIMR